jgi:hypothetical protein
VAYEIRKLTQAERFFADLLDETCRFGDEIIPEDQAHMMGLYGIFLDFATTLEEEVNFAVIVERTEGVYSSEVYNQVKRSYLYHVLIGSGLPVNDPYEKCRFLDFTKSEYSIAAFIIKIAKKYHPNFREFKQRNNVPQSLLELVGQNQEE